MKKIDNYGQIIRAKRQNKNIKAINLAKELGITPAYLSLIESNQRKPDGDLLLRIQDILELQREDLTKKTDPDLETRTQEVVKISTRKIYNYGQIIRAKRQNKNIKAINLAKELGITPAYLSLIESNQRKPDGDLLLRIQDILELQREDLTKKTDPDLETRTQEVVKISLLEDLDIRSDEVQEIVQLNPKIAKALIKLGIDHKNKELELGQKVENKIYKGSTTFPGEIVSDYIQKFENYFPKLEEFSTRIYEKVKMNNRTRYLSLCSYLERNHNIIVRDILPKKDKPFTKIFFPEKKEFYLSDALNLETKKLFAAALVAQLEADDIIEEYLDDFSFPSEPSRKVTKVALLNYAGAAIIMPYEIFFYECVKKHRYDLELLQSTFAVSFEQVCHRVTCLNNPKLRGIPLHMIRVDRSGNVSKRFSLSGIELPRLSGACPKWNVYSSFSNPGKISAAVSRMTDGERYVCIARTVEKGISKYGEEKGLLSIGLGCQIKYAKDFVYADGLNLNDEKSESKIGVSCRKCDRLDCSQRAFPPDTQNYDVNINQRGVSIFVNE